MSDKNQEEFKNQCVRSFLKIEDIVHDYMNEKIGARQAMAEIGLHSDYLGLRTKADSIVDDSMKKIRGSV